MVKGFIKKLKLGWQEVVLVIFALTYLIYFTTASFLRYIHYYTGKFDLGNMSQTVWNTLHGNIFMLTDPNGVEEISRLAVHADFILILLTPFYLIWEDPRMLLLIQTFVLTFGGIFVYLITNKVLKNKTISLVLAFAYYLNPAVQFTNLYDFHAVVLATTFLLAAFYFILIRKWWLVLLFLFLAGITKEQVWAINALLGIYIVFVSKERIIGTAIAVTSSILFFLMFWVAIPNATSGGGHFALEFYSKYGNSPDQIIKNIILNPIQVVQDMNTPEKIEYLRQLFKPLGYLSLLALPFLIFATPDLTINLLSDFPPMHQIWYQYTATITPFIFIATIYAVKFIVRKFPKIKYSYISLFLIIFTLHSANTYGPMFFSDDSNDAWYKKPLENRKIINNYLESIPDEAQVSASNSIGSHMSHRSSIFVVPSGINESDYVVFLLRSKHGKEYEAYQVVKQSQEFLLEFQDKDFYVFKRTLP